MANEYLKRTPTSTGNRRVFTWAGWVKRNSQSSSGQRFFSSGADGDYVSGGIAFGISLDYDEIQLFAGNTGTDRVNTSVLYRDSSSWMHICVVVNTTSYVQEDRFKLYVNGVLYQGTYDNASPNWPSINYEYASNMAGKNQALGASSNSSAGGYFTGQFTDVFLVDGQALTPDVFGFYKEGKGYISAGSTQSTDFRPGQWVPKSPRIIKSEIERRGGFGVNGFYLPMNDSSNFGADFHCEPNSIITLKGEDLPQPRNGAPTTTDAYVSQLRSDPYAANLVLALPFVSGGLNSGFGDYAPSIKGSGSAKTITTTSVSIANTAGYYGSAMYVVGPNNYATAASSSDFNFGTGDFTVECWVYLLSQGNSGYNHYLSINDQNTFAFKSWSSYYYLYANSTTAVQTSNAPRLNQWTHLALVRKGTTLTIFENGVAAGITTNYTSSLGATAAAQIGNSSSTAAEGLNGYLQDLRVYKGIAKYTSGFDVPKPYTPVGIGTWRAVADSTANNFATLNPLTQLDNGNITYTNGNLSGYVSANTNSTTTTIGISSISSQKYYAEFRATNSSYPRIGVIDATVAQQGIFASGSGAASANNLNTSGVISWGGIGNELYINSSTPSYSAASYTNGDIIGVAYDSATRNVWFSKNGTWQNFSGSGANPATGTNPVGAVNGSDSVYFGIRPENSNIDCNFGQNPTFSGKIANVIRVNSSDSSWDQTPNTGSHNDWTISNEGRDLNVAVSAGFYARAYLYLDPNEKYLLSFDYISGTANLGILSDTLGYLKATDGSLSPNGLSAGNSYTFEISNSNWINFTGFNSQTYDINNIYLTRVVPGYQDSNGKGEFRYQPPSGFLALCSDNLPEPVISDPGEHFKTVLYTGDGNSGRSITGVGFQPDLVWIKDRTRNERHLLADSVRGSGNILTTIDTRVEENNRFDMLTSFDSDGFTVGNAGPANFGTDNFVAWCWKAGGEAVTNTDGTITSQVSVNQDAGFSIVSYIGNSSSPVTIGHGLGKKPGFIIVRNRDLTSTWYCYHSVLGATKRISLESTAAAFSGTGLWNSTEPSSTVFTTVSDIASNNNGSKHIAYCWAEIEGFSKFGSYVGNGNADGAFVYLGFKPAWVMIKGVDNPGSTSCYSSGYTSWGIWDSSRQSTNPASGLNVLWANRSYAEGLRGNGAAGGSFLDIDLLSNGFKIRGDSNCENNSNGITYIFAAFAESPFQTANSK